MRSSCFIFFTFYYFAAFAQLKDTLIDVDNVHIPCKVIKVAQVYVEYYVDIKDSVIHIMDAQKVKEIHFADGMIEKMNKHYKKEDKDRSSALKSNPFAPFYGQVILGYENTNDFGIGVELNAGLINNSITDHPYSGAPYANLTQGGEFSFGI